MPLGDYRGAGGTGRQSRRTDMSNVQTVHIMLTVQAEGYGQNGDKPKRLQVQSKHINLLLSTMDLFSGLLTKF